MLQKGPTPTPKIMKSFTCSITIANITLVLSINTTNSLATKLIEKNYNFIKSSCGVTIYQEICYKTLSPYASTIRNYPTQLANVALNVTLKSAKSTTRHILNMLKSNNIHVKTREFGAIRDCVENLKDSIGEIQQSLVAMKDLELGGPDFEVGLSNIQTLVSAALTDEDMCMDGFEGMELMRKDFVRSCVVRVAMLTSNALAPVNQLF